MLAQTKEPNGAYFMLTKDEAVPLAPEDHDYEEPYFEPASEEEDLLQQLKKLCIPVIKDEKDIQ